MRRAALLGLSLMLVVGVIGGCSSSAGNVSITREYRVDFTPDQKHRIEYRIRQGDVLAIHDLFNVEIRQAEVNVLPDGTATFIGIDRFRVAGMTLNALDAVLTARYAEEFRDPQIDVILVQIGARMVYVLGEVDRPGSYKYLGPGFNVVSAIAAAGGYTDTAQPGSVALVRMTADGYFCRNMDLSDISSSNLFDPEIMDLQPFDIIFVSRSAIGDFSVFTKSLVSAIATYTDLAVDVKYLTDSDDWRR